MKTPLVFFNASVILAGLYSPSGGSAKLLKLSKQKLIKGVISEIVFDETVKHASKIRLKKEEVKKLVLTIFSNIYPAPKEKTVNRYKKVVIDYGDAHLLASAKEIKADFLVTLDKKHLLVLQKKIKKIRIVSPKQLIEKLSKITGVPN